MLDDAHDEGAETLTLTLSEPFDARLIDAEATGTIVNDDVVPQAWLAGFGRTVAEQVLGAVQDRLREPRAAGLEAQVAGRRIPVEAFGAERAPAAGAPTADATAALPGGTDELLAWVRGEPETSGGRILSGRELLSESAFQTAAPTAGGGNLTLWGGGAVRKLRRARRCAGAGR